MSINLYDTTIVPMKTMLSNLGVWLKKAEEHAKSKSIPETEFSEGRLAADMLPLPNQVYIACNAAKFLAVRVAGHEDQVFQDDQKTLAELQERVAATVKYLDGVKREEFNDPEILTKEIATPAFTAKGGLDYCNQFAMPNFFFHIVTSYDILRHKGLDVGKKDFIAAAKIAAQ